MGSILLIIKFHCKQEEKKNGSFAALRTKEPSRRYLWVIAA